jgi:Aminotransferase class I and II
MDGDLAPVEELVTLCAGLGALLVIDEAHAVLGPHPELAGVEPRRVGTLSKTLGALGGYVAGPGPLIERLRNRARSFIFTTATSRRLPPRRWRPSGSSARRRARRSASASAATSSGSHPATHRRSCR